MSQTITVSLPQLQPISTISTSIFRNLITQLNYGGVVLGIAFLITLPAHAIAPVAIDRDADVPWSSLIDHPFDGKIVYPNLSC